MPELNVVEPPSCSLVSLRNNAAAVLDSMTRREAFTVSPCHHTRHYARCITLNWHNVLRLNRDSRASERASSLWQEPNRTCGATLRLQLSSTCRQYSPAANESECESPFVRCHQQPSTNGDIATGQTPSPVVSVGSRL
ncbi:hypothetical protein LSAT2_006921 [Lamellibrachia satsuma]|nr:hypothetical protein LSAT2_006921 [Lamellibrachia satsuma]